MKIEVDFRFDSAHFLPYVADNHKCKNMHGHTYWTTIVIDGEVNQQGWIMDFADIKAIVEPIIKILDHNLLNSVPGLENPTVENITKYLYNTLKPLLPNLYQIKTQETPFSRCTYPN